MTCGTSIFGTIVFGVAPSVSEGVVVRICKIPLLEAQ